MHFIACVMCYKNLPSINASSRSEISGEMNGSNDQLRHLVWKQVARHKPTNVHFLCP